MCKGPFYLVHDNECSLLHRYKKKIDILARSKDEEGVNAQQDADKCGTEVIAGMWWRSRKRNLTRTTRRVFAYIESVL